MNFKIKFILPLIAVLLTSCSTGKIKMDRSFFSNKNLKISVAMEKFQPGSAYKSGAQGLLDVAISNAMSSSLEGYLSSFDQSKMIEMKDTFSQALTQKGFQSVTMNELIDTSELPKFKKSSKGTFESKQFSSVKQLEGSDAVVLISVKEFGTIRYYYAMSPLGPPQGYISVQAELIRLRDNKILWRDTSTIKQPVIGKWDEKPTYPNITQAIHTAIDTSTSQLINSFSENL